MAWRCKREKRNVIFFESIFIMARFPLKGAGIVALAEVVGGGGGDRER